MKMDTSCHRRSANRVPKIVQVVPCQGRVTDVILDIMSPTTNIVITVQTDAAHVQIGQTVSLAFMATTFKNPTTIVMHVLKIARRANTTVIVTHAKQDFMATCVITYAQKDVPRVARSTSVTPVIPAFICITTTNRPTGDARNVLQDVLLARALTNVGAAAMASTLVTIIVMHVLKIVRRANTTVFVTHAKQDFMDTCVMTNAQKDVLIKNVIKTMGCAVGNVLLVYLDSFVMCHVRKGVMGKNVTNKQVGV